MPTKIFTTVGGLCPFGRGIEIDSAGCRRCEYFYRTGTATFFWCRHPQAEKPAEIVPQSVEGVPMKKKRGRKPVKAAKKPVKGRKPQK